MRESGSLSDLFLSAVRRNIGEIISIFEKRSRSADRHEAFRSERRSTSKSSAPVSYRRPPTPACDRAKRPSSMVLLDSESPSPYVQKYLEALTADAKKFSHDQSPVVSRRKTGSSKNTSDHTNAQENASTGSTAYRSVDSGGTDPNSEVSRETLVIEPSSFISRFLTRRSSSNSSSSSSSSSSSRNSVNNANVMSSASSNVHLDGLLLGKSQDESDLPQPTVSSPSIQLLEQKLVDLGHYQIPKQTHSPERSSKSSLSSTSENKDQTLGSADFSTETALESRLNSMLNSGSSMLPAADNRNIEFKLNFNVNSNFDNHPYANHSYDLESDDDGPTSYDVSLYDLLIE